MIYQKAGNRCAFTLGVPGLAISEDFMLKKLARKGFEVLDAGDMVQNARQLIGKSRYRKYAWMRDAPAIVDCSSMIKWLYGLHGIFLPRNLFLWQESGEHVSFGVWPNSPEETVAGDIVFTTDVDRTKVGHVGLASGPNAMIHATNDVGVEEISFDDLARQRKVCQIRRIIPVTPKTVTLLIPEKERSEIESSDDIEFLFR